MEKQEVEMESRKRDRDAEQPGVNKARRLLQQALHGTQAAANTQHGDPHGADMQRAGASRTAAAATAADIGGDDGDADDEELLAAIPSELMASLLLLRSRVQRTTPDLPAVVLTTQLSAAIRDSKDATSTDRELDRMRRENTIRMFKLSTGPDEHAVLLTRDYEQLLMQSAQAQACSARAMPPPEPSAGVAPPGTGRRRGSKGAPEPPSQPHVAVVRAFCERVLPTHTDMRLSHDQLLRLLAAPASGNSTRAGADTVEAAAAASAHDPGPYGSASCSLPSLDEQVSILMQAGALSRHTGDAGTYMLSVPGLGPVVKAITAGRREVQGLLARKKYKEAPEQLLLEKTKLRRSPMGMAFHMQDMLGLGLLARVDTTVGPIIRLLKQ